MAYAVTEDIIELYGEQALFIADRDGDGQTDTAAITRALQAATDEIDSFIAKRHALPLEHVSALVVQYCVDIALYRLANTADVMSSEIRQRYEDARQYFKDVADGKAVLVQPVAAVEGGEAGDTAQAERPEPIVSGGPDKVWTRDKMRGL